MKRLPPTFERIVAGLAMGLIFLVMASVFAPDFTQADSNPAAPGAPSTGAPSTDPHAGLFSLGTIEDEQHLVRIYAGPDGPLYSVYDGKDGRELGVLLTAEQVAARFPEVPLPTMDFGTTDMGLVNDEM